VTPLDVKAVGCGNSRRLAEQEAAAAVLNALTVSTERDPVKASTIGKKNGC
jgi:hypothetical protein